MEIITIGTELPTKEYSCSVCHSWLRLLPYDLNFECDWKEEKVEDILSVSFECPHCKHENAVLGFPAELTINKENGCQSVTLKRIQASKFEEMAWDIAYKVEE